MNASLSRISRNAVFSLVLSLTAFTLVAITTIGLLAGPGRHGIFAGSIQVTLTAGVIVLAGIACALLLPRFTDVCRDARESREHEAKFLAATAATSDAIFLLEPVRNHEAEITDFTFKFLNDKAYELVKLPSEVLLGGRMCELLPFFRAERLFDQYKTIMASGKASTSEFPLNDPSLAARWLRSSVIRYEHGLVLSLTDVTEQKEFESNVRHAAHHDALTGLPNRMLLDDRIQQAMERAKRNRQLAAVLILDLDGFKGVVENFGHAAGDHVLRSVASRLRGSIRATDSLFRLGGDQFVIVVGDLASRSPVADFARKIVVSLLPPIPWRNQTLDISASIGVAVYPDDGATPESLLVQADMEMFRMKRAHVVKAEAAFRTGQLDIPALLVDSRA